VRVSLFIPCLVDQLWPSAGIGTARVLERIGCRLSFDPRQTCCGQPAFNSGYRREAARLARRLIVALEATGPDGVVCPSGSCTAMVHHFGDCFPDEPSWAARAKALAERTYELGGFLVNVLGVQDVGAEFRGRVAWHDACHGLRDLGLREEPRRLLAGVRGLELVELAHADACCGFGGAFSVKHPELSVAIVDEKVRAIVEAGVNVVASSDVSCLMQIGGRLARLGSPVRTMHLAEILASQAAGA